MTEFLAANWLWIALVVAMLAMHRHGGCGMHGHHRHQSPERDTEHVHGMNHHSGDETGHDHSIHAGHGRDDDRAGPVERNQR